MSDCAIHLVSVVIVETPATRAMRHALPWLGLEIRWDSLTWKVIKLVLAMGALALLVLLRALRAQPFRTDEKTSRQVFVSPRR